MTRGRKRWISVQADGRLVAALDREAEARGVSRSGAIREAVEGWLLRAMEEDEGRITRQEDNHRRVMNRLEFVVGMIREQDRRIERLAGRGAQSGPQAGPSSAEAGGALAEARKRARRRSG